MGSASGKPPSCNTTVFSDAQVKFPKAYEQPNHENFEFDLDLLTRTDVEEIGRHIKGLD